MNSTSPQNPSPAQPACWQRIFRRIISTRSGARFASKTGHRIDRLGFRMLNGRFLFSNVLVGLPIVMLNVEGAKSKRSFTIPLVGIPAEDKILLVASNWGGARHPAWYYNILANPEVTLTVQGQTKRYVAHEASGAEREGYWRTVVDFYPGYGAYQARTGERQIPIMVLESM